MTTFEGPPLDSLTGIGALTLGPMLYGDWFGSAIAQTGTMKALAAEYHGVAAMITHAFTTLPFWLAIAGVATAGIAQGALVADLLEMPYLYVRPEPKKHGMGNQIEGKLLAGQKVVLVEDLVSTGGSSLKAGEAIKAAGAEVVGMAAIFTYGFSVADDNFRKAGVRLYCLSNYNALLEAALANGYIPADAVEALAEWRKSPETWG